MYKVHCNKILISPILVFVIYLVFIDFISHRHPCPQALMQNIENCYFFSPKRCFLANCILFSLFLFVFEEADVLLIIIVLVQQPNKMTINNSM